MDRGLGPFNTCVRKPGSSVVLGVERARAARGWDQDRSRLAGEGAATVPVTAMDHRREVQGSHHRMHDVIRALNDPETLLRSATAALVDALRLPIGASRG
jgi:hypothetical protein